MSTELNADSSRYARSIDLEDRLNPHTLAVLLVGEGSRVLDVGTATGSVAGALRERGARVWGIEIDKEAAAEAARFCEQVVVGDVEELDLREELNQDQFDWLLFLDVLEHLRDPRATLERCLDLLAPGGRVLISLPNIAHASVRLQLLRGHFQYTDTGLLDHTHLRFFEEQSMRQLLASAGLSIEEEFPIRRSEMADVGEESDVSSDFKKEIDEDPTSAIYQFVIVARPASSSNGRAHGIESDVGSAPVPKLAGELWRRVDTLEQQVREGAEHTHDLTGQIMELTRRAERVGDLEGSLAERMNELRVRDSELKHLRLDLGLKEAHVVELRTRVLDAETELANAKAELASARAKAEEEDLLREQIAMVEWRLSQALERMEYGRYRAADRLSAAVKQLPGVHRIARFVVETLFSRR